MTHFFGFNSNKKGSAICLDGTNREGIKSFPMGGGGKGLFWKCCM